MAIAPQTTSAETLTYEDYMAEGEINRRYDILDGVRIYMTNPTRRHQRILGNIYILLRNYEFASGWGQALMAPCDVLIRRNPLRTRQPDVLFISNAQLARCGDPADPAPLEAAPELVVEILSPTETRAIRSDKLADYQSVGVQECWVVSPDTQTVEVLRLTPELVESVATYENDQTLRSVVFPDLTVPVAEMFAS
jgi:Uma2 family endonuclease